MGWLASSMHHSGEVMSLLATTYTQLELPVSKNALLYLHWVAKGQIMQRSGPALHFWRAESVGWTAASLQGSRVPIPVVWRVVRVVGNHRLNSAGFWMEDILGQLWWSDEIVQ